MAVFTVFGAAGWIGSALVQSLMRAGHDVRGFARDQWPDDGTDLGNVIYAIGMTADFRGRPIATAEAHVSVLLEVMQRFSFQSLLYLSTTRVYRNSDSTSEDATLSVRPADPDDVYNATKLAGEAVCLSLPSATTRVARLSNVIGAGVQSASFVASLIHEARSGMLRVNTAPDSAKDYVALGDVTRLCEAIALGGKHRVYNVASGINVSHRDIADLIASRMGARVDFAPDAPVQYFPPIAVDRIRGEFGIVPAPFETAFTELLGPQVNIS